MSTPISASSWITRPNWQKLASMAVLALIFVCPVYSADSDLAVQVQLDSNKATPRTVESLTEQGVIRNYRAAWSGMAHALEFNTVDPLELSFTGEAKQRLAGTIKSQGQSGLTERYLNQKHKLEAVFYAPEGDVIELHDTAEYQRQILDGSKVIHDERVVAYYVVLMTPSADRWVVRYLQRVSQF